MEVIGQGEKGVYIGDSDNMKEVEIIGVRCTPNGPVYDIKLEITNLKRSLGIQTVRINFWADEKLSLESGYKRNQAQRLDRGKLGPKSCGTGGGVKDGL